MEGIGEALRRGDGRPPRGLELGNANLRELEGALTEWRRMFNEERPHPSLGWSTPSAWREARVSPPLAVAS